MLKDYTGPIFILIAATLWAFDGLIRQHLYSLPPITIIFFEHLIGLILLFPFVWSPRMFGYNLPLANPSQ